MKLTAVHTHVFKENADLPLFIKDYIPSLEENTVLAVASKLVCLWLGLSVPYQNAAQKEALIKKESSAALKTPLAWLTIKAGMVMTNAGVDESNAQGKLLLLPKDCYRSAADLRARLQTIYGIKNLGVLITDSMILPLRAGVVAGAVGYAGFKGVRDLRGKPDIYGKKLAVTLVNAADSLASAAALCMGEANEQTPLCVIEQAPVTFSDEINPREISYPVQDDLYTPLFRAAGLISQGEKND